VPLAGGARGRGVRPGRYQLSHSCAGIGGRHETGADEHRVGTGGRVFDQIEGATDAGFRNLHNIARQSRCDLLETRPVDSFDRFRSSSRYIFIDKKLSCSISNALYLFHRSRLLFCFRSIF
jgi:hypothetical protein